MEETKELCVTSGPYQCLVDVTATDTIADVRRKALEDFDDDMLPSTDFFVAIGGVRLSSKQEATKMAWQVVGRNVSFHAKKRVSEESFPQSKKLKTDDETVRKLSFDTPKEKDEGPMDDGMDDGVFNESDILSDIEVMKESNDPVESAKDLALDDVVTPTGTKKDAVTPSDTLTFEDDALPKKVSPSASEEIQVVLAPNSNPHNSLDAAVSQSCEVLKSVQSLLQDPENALFCSDQRRTEWLGEIAAKLNDSAPNTIIGCLGSTGVGKSSLLNALLDEASILPTSGSRGCTAAVVELRYNPEFLKPSTSQETTVYKGQVEFMALQEWLAELQVLLDECSTNDTHTLYARVPEAQRQPEAAAAWAKINSVYGRGFLEGYHGSPKTIVWDRLSRDHRVLRLLKTENGKNNVIEVSQGSVNAQQASLFQDMTKLKGKMKRTQKRWAKDFRAQINEYVYRAGDGNRPQSWPLIRKVVLYGPWSVLKSGACLVDLPGVRDANAARAKVAESYLQNCHSIWVCAPIKRAVDDGTAKELLGEQFKRRLLMDGKYNAVSFVCTQTDDVEASEIMRDHADDAQAQPGRWERMTQLQEKIAGLDKERLDLIQQEDEIKDQLEDAQQVVKDLKEELKEAAEDETEILEGDDDEDDDCMLEENDSFVSNLKCALAAKEEAMSIISKQLDEWRQVNSGEVKLLEGKSVTLQKELRVLASLVRSEYSTRVLQADFRAGLDELTTQQPEEMQEGQSNDLQFAPLPDDFAMEVNCVASNDYLKLQKIKPSSDGPPNTFSKAEDTQIPALRRAVHKTTAAFRSVFVNNFVSTTSDFLDRIKLCATQNREDSESKFRFKRAFESQVHSLESHLSPIVSDFIRKAEEKVNYSLQPSLQKGSLKGRQAALSTVTSWGSKSRRNKNYRGPEQNGLYWSTYNATVRRNGVFSSGCAGAIDFNQELCDPMEKEFSADWQQIMDGAIRSYLQEAEGEVVKLFEALAKDIVASFAQAGMELARLNVMANTANRTTRNALAGLFQAMRTTATGAQRNLNRSLLPAVTERMEPGYEATMNVAGGAGRFSRMKNAMQSHTGKVVTNMFTDATQELLASIGKLIKQLASMIQSAGQAISKTLSSVYSVCWDDQTSSLALVDEATQEKMRECRNKLIPGLIQLREAQDRTMDLVGIEREEEEFDIVGVDSLDNRLENMMNQAKDTGNFIDLADSDAEDDHVKQPAQVLPLSKVKPEPQTAGNFNPNHVTPNPVAHPQSWVI